MNTGEANDVQTLLRHLLVDRTDQARQEAHDAVRRLAQRSRDRLMAGMDGAHAATAFGAVQLPMMCRSCGCTDEDACDGGCGWAGNGLCTSCASGHELLRGRRVDTVPLTEGAPL